MILGECYYCHQPVDHTERNDYGAFTKKWSKKENRFILSDFWHMHCYFVNMNRALHLSIDDGKAEEYEQMSIFDFMKGETNDNRGEA